MTKTAPTKIATFESPEIDDPVLPGMELLRQPLADVPTYLCIACWRRIPVGVHSHACFFAE